MIENELPHGQWMDCTEELRERLAEIDTDHMDLATELLPAKDEHDDSGSHRHLIDEDTQADLMRYTLAQLDSVKAQFDAAMDDHGAERAAHADNWMGE